jgi:hypothetical protein
MTERPCGAGHEKRRNEASPTNFVRLPAYDEPECTISRNIRQREFLDASMESPFSSADLSPAARVFCLLRPL